MTELEQLSVGFRNEAEIPKHVQALLEKADGRKIVELPIPRNVDHQQLKGVRVLRIFDVIGNEWVYRADVCFKKQP